MTTSETAPLPWTADTTERLNVRFNVIPDDDVGTEDWPVAMADPSLVTAALEAFDDPAARADERALIVEFLLNTFEFSSIERDGNPDWRRTLDRIERDFAEHAATVQRWAEPDDGNPYLISSALASLIARQRSRA